jgi:endonuclease/exonuclease/phosphatase family metal-dependent hydrolase
MKVLTLNLHNPDSWDLDPIAGFLDASGAELCVLTECNEAATRRLGELLECAGVAHAHAPYWGNGLLTRTLPVLGAETLDLPRASTGERRSAVRVEVDAPWGPLRVLGTHLEHLREEDRLRQVRHLHDRADLGGAVLLGDLNSLRAADYSPERWEEIGRQRARAHLTPAATEVTGFLFDELGLLDAHLARAEGSPFAPTCPYGTRIDYICVGASSGARPVPGSYRVLDAMGPDLTDHDAVLVELGPA